MNNSLASLSDRGTFPHRHGPRLCSYLRAFVPALLGLAGAAAQAQVVINPVVVEFAPRQRVASVTISLSDTATRAMRLQAEVLSWRQDLQGKDLTAPSTDLLVTPPIAELRPGQKQLFRVALRGPRQGSGELAYRLVLEDVAPPAPEAPPTDTPDISIRLRMRYDLPVLLAPAGPVVNQLRWKPCVAAPAEGRPLACVRLSNAGNRRVKVQALTLSGANWEQTLALGEGANVLSGAEREWRVPLQPGQAGAPLGVRVRTVDGQSIQAEAEPGDR
jgi:fimbrial chaperone protein